MELPARIGKYELEEFLGGGMSHVYRARDTVIGRTVAVKILTEAGCQDEEAKARFLAEARMAGNIEHDNVLSIYDFGEDEHHRPFMVMEFLRGEDLRAAIRNGRTGDLASKLRIALQTARALQFVHTQKVIHRDIKPENIHITNNGVVKLMDFGIAKTEGLAMTRAGYVLGTPYYMAPEQVMGQEITEQVDVYAFGILLFELITGSKPITGDAVERIFYSILNEPLNLEPLQAAGAPEAMCSLVARCTQKNPAERPRGFAPVCSELERMVADLEAPTVVLPQAQPAPPPPAPRPAWLLPAILGLVVLLAVGLWWALKNRNVVVPEPEKKEPELAKVLPMPSGEMLLVPGGVFLRSADKTPDSLPPFYVDKTEVTNQAYAQFCSETGHSLPEDFPKDKPDYPVVNVSILDARDYAKWAEKRLPNAREWEKAARGTDGRLFPWGNEPEASRANLGCSKPHAPKPCQGVTAEIGPVTGFPNGASPCGALNMVGNVWELVEQLSTPGQQALDYFGAVMKPAPTAEDPWYMIRGGGISNADQGGLTEAILYDFATIPAKWKDWNIGFRCVKDPPAPPPAAPKE